MNPPRRGAPYPLRATFFAAALAGARGASRNQPMLALGSRRALAQFPYAPGGPHLARPRAMTTGLGPDGGTALGGHHLAVPGRAGRERDSVTIHAGATVTWTNQSNNAPHTVTVAPVGAAFPTLNPFSPPSGGNVYDGTTLVNSGVLGPTQSFSLKFTTVGTYTYHCIFHDDTENMIGTVIVTP